MTERYSHGHHRSVLRSHGTRTAADSAGYLLPHLRAGMTVLDVGCGPGTITLDLAELVAPGGRVVGIDAAPAAVAAARESAAARHGSTAGQYGSAGAPHGSAADGRARREDHAHTSFAVADVYALPYDDATYDVVHAHQLLQHLGDPVAALREMARVTRPGGLLAARDADYAAMTWHPASAGMTHWLSTYRELARANGAEPDAGRRLRAWAHAAGLREVTATASAWSYGTPEETSWWAGRWAERAVQSAFAEQAMQLGLATEAELAQIAAAWRAWGEHPDAWFGMLHGEILARV